MAATLRNKKYEVEFLVPIKIEVTAKTDKGAKSQAKKWLQEILKDVDSNHSGEMLLRSVVRQPPVNKVKAKGG